MRAPLRVLALAVFGVMLVSACSTRGAFAQEPPKRRGFSIKITSPQDREMVIGKTKISAEVKIDKPEAIEKVEFYVGDKLVFIDQEAPYECFYNFGPEPKEWVVRAIAYHREEITVSDFIVTRRLNLSFSVRVNRVLIDATVFDEDGNFVKGLGKSDFTVLEEGHKREILDFTPETRPILMGILLDVSGSMKETLPEAQAAASGFVDTLRDDDHAMLVEFSEKVYMLSDLSNDRPALKKLIGSTHALGGTALYDALHCSLRRLRPYDDRKAVVILSDGEDTQSNLGYKQVIEQAKASDVSIYTIALGSGFAEAGARDKLQELAEQTGGRYFRASKASQLEKIYTQIAEELRSQYALAYASENTTFDGRWITIKIEPVRKGLEVRARKGYFAIAPPEP